MYFWHEHFGLKTPTRSFSVSRLFWSVEFTEEKLITFLSKSYTATSRPTNCWNDLLGSSSNVQFYIARLGVTLYKIYILLQFGIAWLGLPSLHVTTFYWANLSYYKLSSLYLLLNLQNVYINCISYFSFYIALHITIQCNAVIYTRWKITPHF